MSKQKLYTVMGIALSFTIAIGGWGLTSMLLDKKSDALLSAVGITHIDMAASPQPAGQGGASTLEILREQPQLTEAEIANVLLNWESSGNEWAHEPMAGQLSMEQIIEIGKAGLIYFYEQGVISTELPPYEYDKITAYLCQNLPRVPEVQTLDPMYSYWTVSFAGESISANLTINALTGQIWRANISHNSPIVNYSDMDVGIIAESAIDAFTLRLGMGTNDEIDLVRDEYHTLAHQSIADGMFHATVVIRSRIVDDKEVPITIQMYLSAQSLNGDN